MSQNRKLTSLVSVFALFGVTGVLAAACGNKDNGDGTSSCSTVSGRVSALQDSSAALTEVAANIKVDVAGACAKIAGMDAPATPSDNDVTTICNAAKAKIDAALRADAKVSIVIVPPQCTVDAQAQLDCEASCYGEAEVTCDPGQIEARCDPGQLSVECSGKCEANAYCEGSVDVAVDCQAKCEGSCTGTCSGTCQGTCEGTCDVKNTDGSCAGKCTGTCTGKCDLNCEGKCNGSCQVKADGGVNCGANARCKGGCDVAGTAPKCEANLKPPSCEGNAKVDCHGDCEGSASLQAQCTKPTVDVVGMADATLATNLKAALPTLIQVTGKAKIAGDAVTKISTNMGKVAADVGSCVLDVGASVVSEFSAAAKASVAATASVSVSFSASASVTGSASGGAS